MTIEMVKDNLPDFNGSACLVKDTDHDKYYVVSSVASAFDTGLPETLVFAANENGEVSSFRMVAGGEEVTREGAIEDLAHVVNGGKHNHSQPGLGGLGALLDIFDDEEDIDGY